MKKILAIFILLSVSAYSQTVGTFVKDDYSSGKYSTLSNFNGTPNFTSKTYSGDIYVFTYKNFVYLLEVASTSKIHKFSIDNTENDLFTYNGEDGYPLDSTNDFLTSSLCTGSFTGSNPLSIDFVSETKAYLVLYNYSKVLIVNPSANSFNDFKIGEIDFTSYADSDQCPETRSVKVYNNRAYFSLQLIDRDDSWAVSNDAKLVIVDTNTDTVSQSIEFTGLRNPNSEIKLKNDKIYISFQGPSYPVDETYGGLVSVNTDDNTYQNLISNTSITHFDFYNNTIFFLNYIDWGNIALKRADLDDIQNTLEPAFDFTGGQNLFGLMVENNNLWVLDRSSSLGGFHIIDLLTEEKTSYTLSEYLPYSIAYNNTETGVIERKNKSILVYPNPSTGAFKIILNEPANSLKIRNLSGQILQSVNIKSKTYSLDFKGLSNGIYFLEIETDKGIFVKKLLINK